MDNIRLLYIDLFCGAGGTSTGVEKANYKERKCAKVIACVNHDANKDYNIHKDKDDESKGHN